MCFLILPSLHLFAVPTLGKFRSYAPTVLSVEAHDVDDVIVQLHGCASRLGCRAGDVVESASGAEFSQLPPDEQVCIDRGFLSSVVISDE